MVLAETDGGRNGKPIFCHYNLARVDQANSVLGEVMDAVDKFEKYSL